MEGGQRVALVNAAPDPKTAPVRLYLIGWTNSPVEPDWAIRPLLDSREAPPKLSNTSCYNNPKLDELLDQAAAETDEKKRMEIYAEAQRIIWEDQPIAYLTFEDNLAAWNKRLKNFHPLGESTWEFYDAYWEE